MALVNFTLSEEGVGAFNDALLCIHKFSDDVSLELKKDKVGDSFDAQFYFFSSRNAGPAPVID